MLQATSTTSTTSTTQGTPRTATRKPRFVFPTNTTATPATTITATFSTVTLAGGAARLLARLRLSRITMYTPASATAAAMTIQPAAGLTLPFSMSFSTLLVSRMVPPEPGAALLMTYNSSPWPISRPASVTTKDGSLSRVMITPWSAPYAVVNASPASTATHHGTGLDSDSSHSVMVAPIAEEYPIDRSISPSSSTNTSAMPSVMIHAAWVIRLTRFPADRNSELRSWKYTTIAIRPTITGSAP